MKVTFDPAFLAATGLSEAETAIDLPDDFGSYSLEQRRAWARRLLEETALAVLADLEAALGIEPSEAQRTAYLADIQLGLDEVLAGGGR